MIKQSDDLFNQDILKHQQVLDEFEKAKAIVLKIQPNYVFEKMDNVKKSEKALNFINNQRLKFDQYIEQFTQKLDGLFKDFV